MKKAFKWLLRLGVVVVLVDLAVAVGVIIAAAYYGVNVW
jgi:hypothetical protein